MEPKQFKKWFKREVTPRWPAWQINKVKLTDWFAALANFDELTITQAVSFHRIEDEPAIPSIKKVRAFALELTIQKLRAENNRLKHLLADWPVRLSQN